MHALVIHAAHDLRLEERAPGAPGPGEVLVRIERGGICGSDLHYFHHGGFGAVRLREPMILGHEVSGRIVETGEGVEGLAPGDLVAVSPSRPCGTCAYCREGLANHCLDMRFFGSAMRFPHVQGAFRQYLVADAGQCVRAEGLSAGEAAMAEPLAVCLHAARRAGELLGARVLITGCGPIGLLCVLLARRAGAAEITVTDLTDLALEKAIAAGADRAINVATDPEGLGPDQEGKGRFDVQFECSGTAAGLGAGIAALRPRGRLVQIGFGGDMSVPVQLLTAKEITLSGAFRFHAEFALAVEMMARGLIATGPLLTHTVPLAEAVDGFALASDRARAMKVQIDFA